MNRYLSEWYDKHQKEQYEKQYVTMENKAEKHVTEFQDKSVTIDEYKNLRMNSYAQDLFFEKMDDELLIERAQYFASQCGRYNYPASTYNDAVIHVIIPELIKRLQLKEKVRNC